jgi:hypothetical protein
MVEQPSFEPTMACSRVLSDKFKFVAMSENTFFNQPLGFANRVEIGCANS